MRNSRISKGFTLLELMMALAIAAIMYNTFMVQYFNNLATQKSRTNAVLHQGFAIEYSNYIQDNYAAIWNQIGNGRVAVIPYSTLKTDGYSSGIYNTSNFTPCAIVLADPNSNMLFPLIVDVTGNTSYVSPADSLNGAIYLGDYAAVYSNGRFNGYGGWNIDMTTSAYFTNSPLSACDFANLVPNSIAINLVLTPFFMQHQKDIGLSRILDNSSLGSQNKNISQTDITLGYPFNSDLAHQYNRIFFSSDNTVATQPYCASGMSLGSTSPYYLESNVVCSNSRLVTNFISPRNSEGITLGGRCTNQLVGTITQDQSGSDKTSGLICSYNPLLCTLISKTSSSTCYLSTLTKMVKYFMPPNTTTYTCPNETPIAIDAVTDQQLLQMSYCQSTTNDCSGATMMTVVIPYSSKVVGSNILTYTSIATPIGNIIASTGANSSSIAMISTTSSSAECGQLCGLFKGSAYTSVDSKYCHCAIGNGAQINISYSNLLNLPGTNLGDSNLLSVTCSNLTVHQ